MLDSAESLILELGTRRVTLKEVGERAGYSRGLAHARFGSLDELLIRVIKRGLERWNAQLARLAKDKRGLASILAIIDAAAAFAKQHPNAARVLYVLWFESVGSTTLINESLRRFHHAARLDVLRRVNEAIVANEVSRQTDATQFSLVFTSVLFGMSYQWVVNPQSFDLQEVLPALKLQVLALLGAPSPRS